MPPLPPPPIYNTNLYRLLPLKPYYSEFQALVDLLGLNSTANYPFGSKAPNPFSATSSPLNTRTFFIPNNFAMAQAYSALLIRAGKPPICASADSDISVSCGWSLQRSSTVRSWLDARPDLRDYVLSNMLQMRVLVAGHVLKGNAALRLSALAGRMNMVNGIIARPTDADVVLPGRNALFCYAVG